MNIFIRIRKKLTKTAFSFFWRICCIIYLIQFKFRFKNQKVRLLGKGSGEMFKLVIHFSPKEAFLIKKDNYLTEFWLRYSSKHKLSLNQSKHKNFDDKANVLEFILSSNLKNSTLLKGIDRKRKEYTQVYYENAIDLSFNEDESTSSKLNEILSDFKSHGLISYDHDSTNFIQIQNKIFLVDLDSFEIKKFT